MAEHEQKPERYEDYLESLDPHQLEALVEGRATVVLSSVKRGFDEVRAVLEHEKFEVGSGEQPWIERCAKLQNQEEAAQLVADLDHVISLVQAMRQRAVRRLEVLHREVCDDCRQEYETKSRAKRALRRGIDAAKQAFAEAIEGEDEPWKRDPDEDDEDES